MFSILNLPVKVIGLLESNVSPREIAAGVCLGAFLGLIPLNGPAALLLAVLFFVFRLNRVATLLTLPLFKVVYMLGLYKATERVGEYLLINVDALNGFWRAVTGLPVLGLLDINNTLVAGGFFVAAIVSIPAYFVSAAVAGQLQKTYAAKIGTGKVAKFINAMKIANRIDNVVGPDGDVTLAGLKADIKLTVISKVKSAVKKKGAPKKGLLARINIPGIIISLVILAAIHFGVGMWLSPAVSGIVVEKLNESAGTKVSIGAVNVWPLTLSCSLSDLKVFDPSDPSKRIAQVPRADFHVSPLALLAGRVVVSKATLERAEIDIIGRPDGSFNIQHIGRPTAASAVAHPGSIFDAGMAHKDLFGKVYSMIRQRFSKRAAAETKAAKTAASKVTKTVAEIPKGKRVSFALPRDKYLYEIRELSLRDGRIAITDGGGRIDIDHAKVEIGRLAYDPAGGVVIRSFDIRGVLSREGAVAGSLRVTFERSSGSGGDRARYVVGLNNVDIIALESVYRDSLPVEISKGRVSLNSTTAIANGALEGTTSITLRDHVFAPKAGNEVAFGVVPMAALCNAMNAAQPLELSFSLGGSTEKPELKGLQDALMALAKPYLAQIQKQVMAGGAAVVSDLLAGKKVDGAAMSDTAKDVANSLKSLFGKKMEGAQ